MANGDRRQAQSNESRPSGSYAVSMSESARAAYLKLKEQSRAKDGTANPAIVALAKVEQLIRYELPKDPTNKRFRLYEPFTDVYRANIDAVSMGWVMVGDPRQVLILFLHTGCRVRKEMVPEIIAFLHKGGHLNKLLQQSQALTVPDSATRH